MIHRAFGAREAVAPPALPDSLEPSACYAYCESLAMSRHHNFPVASMFVPAELRRHIWAIYAFARAADDFADEPRYAGRRSLELDQWEAQLESCFHGDAPVHPVFVALAGTIERFELPITPFQSLLSGFRSDLESPRYTTFQELRNYTSRAADPIGQLCLYLSGDRDPTHHRLAEELSTALALVNFWQDLATDVGRGRLYIPLEDLAHFGVTESDLQRGSTTRGVGALIEFQVARTRSVFSRARPLVHAVSDNLAVEVALMWLGGSRILDKIEAAGARVLRQRPQLTAADKARVVTRALTWRGGSLVRRLLR